MVAGRYGIAGVIGEPRLGGRRGDQHAAAAGRLITPTEHHRHRFTDHRCTLRAVELAVALRCRLRQRGTDQAGLHRQDRQGIAGDESAHSLQPFPISLVVRVRGGICAPTGERVEPSSMLMAVSVADAPVISPVNVAAVVCWASRPGMN